MKGLILAGGHGTRLEPATYIMNKHMVPILNRPMILYPLEMLKSLGMLDIMIVTGGNHIGGIGEFLGDGSKYGVNLTYRIQEEAGGIAQALALAKDFAAGGPLVVILGDNIFGVDDPLTRIAGVTIEVDGNRITATPPLISMATIVVKRISGANRFGVLVGNNFIDNDPNHYRIIEKPKNINEGNVVTGLYIYPYDVFEVIKNLKPSERGELEITDVNNYYLINNRCRITHLQNQDFWSDSGTRESLKEVIDWAYKNGK